MAQKKKWLFIKNPISGDGAAVKWIDPLLKEIDKRNLDARIVTTEYRGHAAEIAQEYADKGYTHIAVIAGDGTLNEAFHGIMKAQKKPVLGIIPAGTGNDFNAMTGFPLEFTNEVWDSFFQAKTINLDAGVWEDNYFINGMGIGFDAEMTWKMTDYFNRTGKKSLRIYLWFIISTLFFFKGRPMTLTANGETKRYQSFMCTIANGRRFAGSFFITPKAYGNDGILDMCLIREIGILKRLKILTLVPKGTHLHEKEVDYITADKITIEFDEETHAHLDGETYSSKKFNITVLKKAVKLIYNPEGNHFFKV